MVELHRKIRFSPDYSTEPNKDLEIAVVCEIDWKKTRPDFALCDGKSTITTLPISDDALHASFRKIWRVVAILMGPSRGGGGGKPTIC
jgi:hypothetical protein